MNRLKKFVAMLTAGSFLFSFIFAPALQAALDVPRNVPSQPAVAPAGELLLPYTIGRVTDERFCGGDRVVINIQDLHCHPEVQKNIARILQTLDEKYGISRVYVEGAAGRIDTAPLGATKDGMFRRKLIDSLLSQGKLAGTEYYSLLSGRTDLLSGIEDEKIYNDNIVRLNRIIESRERIQSVTDWFDGAFTTLADRHFSGRHKKFEKTLADYRSGATTPERYYKLLLRQAKRLDVSLEEYGNIRLFLGLLDQQKALRYPTINKELQALMASLKDRIPYATYNDLRQKAPGLAQSGELYLRLMELTREQKIDVGAEFPHLAAFFDFIRLNQAMNPQELLREERALVRELRQRLCAGPSEQEVAFLSDVFGYYKEYLTNKISAEDYDYFIHRKARFEALWEKYGDADSLALLKQYDALFSTFYQTNLERNHRFVKNILGASSPAVRPAPASALPGRAVAALKDAKEVVVVVTGGFHTPGLVELLKERNLTYLVIMPNVTQDTSFADGVYADLVKQQAKVLSQTIALRILAQRPFAEEAQDYAQAAIEELLAGGMDPKDAETKINAVVNEEVLKPLVRQYIASTGREVGKIRFTLTDVQGGEEGFNYKFSISFEEGGSQRSHAYVVTGGKIAPATAAAPAPQPNRVLSALYSSHQKLEPKVRLTGFRSLSFGEKVRYLLGEPFVGAPLWETAALAGAVALLKVPVSAFLGASGFGVTAAAVTGLTGVLFALSHGDLYERGISAGERAKRFRDRLIGGAALALPVFFLTSPFGLVISAGMHSLWNLGVSRRWPVLEKLSYLLILQTRPAGSEGTDLGTSSSGPVDAKDLTALAAQEAEKHLPSVAEAAAASARLVGAAGSSGSSGHSGHSGRSHPPDAAFNGAIELVRSLFNFGRRLFRTAALLPLLMTMSGASAHHADAALAGNGNKPPLLEVSAILENLRSSISYDLLGRAHFGHEVIELLEQYSKAVDQQSDYPVEGAWTVLKAVVQLSREEETELIKTIEKEYDGKQRPALIDAILLMENHVSSNWISEQAAELKGRKVYYISAENTHWSGGLGPVMTFHGRGMKELGADVEYVEPWYQLRRDKGNPTGDPLDYADHGIREIGTVHEFTVRVGDSDVQVRAARGINEAGIPTWLIRDVQPDGSSFYTKMLYNYGKDYNKASWEQFTAFFNLASAELLRRVETQRREEKGKDWKAPVVHTNDGQTAPLAAISKSRYADDSVMSRVNFAFTTHTYRNRGTTDNQGWAKYVLQGMMGISDRWMPGFTRYGTVDYSCGGIRLSDWAGAVSKQHRDDLTYLDPMARLVAVTNGATPEMMARDFRRALTEKYPGADVERPTAEQVMAVKETCKQKLNDLQVRTSNGGTVSIDPSKIVISYCRRLVSEKAGRDRAFTDDNIWELVKNGAQVVLFGNHQGTDESEWHAAWMRDLEKRIAAEKARAPEYYPGSFTFVSAFTAEQKIALLAATDIQVQDSDRATGAAEFSEEDVTANGGLEFSPPYHEGVIMDQGVPVDFNNPGKGNTIIPENTSPQAYLAAFKTAIGAYYGDRRAFYENGAVSVRLNRIQRYLLTSAAYLREYQHVLERKTKEAAQDDELLAAVLASVAGDPVRIEGLLADGRNDIGSFGFVVNGKAESDYAAPTKGLSGFLSKKNELEGRFGYDVLQHHLLEREYRNYFAALFKGLDCADRVDNWFAALEMSPATVAQKDQRFNALAARITMALEAQRSGTRHFEALLLKGERKDIDAQREAAGRSAERATVKNVKDIVSDKELAFLEMVPAELRQLRFGMDASESELGAMMSRAVLALKEWKSDGQQLDIDGLKGRKVLLGLVASEASRHCFEDHRDNGFIGVNATLLQIARRNRNAGAVLLIAGIAHELRHEAGMDEENNALDARLIRDLMREYGVSIREMEAAVSEHFAGDVLLNAVRSVLDQPSEMKSTPESEIRQVMTILGEMRSRPSLQKFKDGLIRIARLDIRTPEAKRYITQELDKMNLGNNPYMTFTRNSDEAFDLSYAVEMVMDKFCIEDSVVPREYEKTDGAKFRQLLDRLMKETGRGPLSAQEQAEVDSFCRALDAIPAAMGKVTADFRYPNLCGPSAQAIEEVLRANGIAEQKYVFKGRYFSQTCVAVRIAGFDLYVDGTGANINNPDGRQIAPVVVPVLDIAKKKIAVYDGTTYKPTPSNGYHQVTYLSDGIRQALGEVREVVIDELNRMPQNEPIVTPEDPTEAVLGGPLHNAVDPVRLVTGAMAQALMMEAAMEREQVGEYAPALAGKNYFLSAPVYSDAFVKRLTETAGAGLNTIGFLSLPPEDDREGFIDFAALGCGRAEWNGKPMDVLARQVTTGAGRGWLVCYLPPKDEKADPGMALAAAQFLSESAAARRVLGLPETGFSVDVFETASPEAHPQLVRDAALRDSRTFRRTAFIYDDGGDDDKVKAVIPEWSLLRSRLFAADIPLNADVRQRLTIAGTALKVSQIDGVTIGEPLVSERLDLRLFANDVPRVVRYINDHAALGVDTFVLASATEQNALSPKDVDVLIAAAKENKVRLLFDAPVTGTADLERTRTLALTLLKAGMNGVRIDLTNMDESMDAETLLAWIRSMQRDTEGINSENVLALIPSRKPRLRVVMTTALGYGGIRKVMRHVVSEEEGAVETAAEVGPIDSNTWVETVLPEEKESPLPKRETIEKEIASLMRSEARMIGFDAGVLEGRADGKNVRDGEQQADFARIFSALVYERLQKRVASQSPAERFEQYRSKAWGLKAGDVPVMSEALRGQAMAALTVFVSAKNGKPGAATEALRKAAALMKAAEVRQDRRWQTVRMLSDRLIEQAESTPDTALQEKIAAQVLGLLRGVLERDAWEKTLASGKREYVDPQHDRVYAWLLVEAGLVTKSISLPDALKTNVPYYGELQGLSEGWPKADPELQAAIDEVRRLEAMQGTNVTAEQVQQATDAVINRLWTVIRRSGTEAHPMALSELLRLLALYELGRKLPTMKEKISDFKALPAATKAIIGAA